MYYEYRNTLETAKFLGISPLTLKKWRFEGKGPEYRKRGNDVKYRVDKVSQWIEDNYKEVKTLNM